MIFPSKNIFLTYLQQTDGTTKPVMSSDRLNAQSLRINRAWRGKKWEGDSNHDVTGNWSNGGALFLLIASFDSEILYTNQKKPFLCFAVLHYLVGTFILGIEHSTIIDIGQYAAAIKRPIFFQSRSINHDMLVDAAMRGQEDMVINILNADPLSLLKKAAVKNSLGMEYTVTALQVAIMTDDFQMAEKMQKYFARLKTDLAHNPMDGLGEMRRQQMEIYEKSLYRYSAIHDDTLKENEIELSKLPFDSERYQAIEKKIRLIKESIIACKEALVSKDIQKMVEAHQQAQAANAFDFTIYSDAILAILPKSVDFNIVNHAFDDLLATQKLSGFKEAVLKTGVSPFQTNTARKKPFDELTIVEKLNHFREKFVKHMQLEIIFNNYHILAAAENRQTVWKKTCSLTYNYEKRSAMLMLIHTQLVGWAQRNASMAVRQDINQGIDYLVDKQSQFIPYYYYRIGISTRLLTQQARTRQPRFNECANILQSSDDSMDDVALHNPLTIAGIGYQFACKERHVSSGRGSMTELAAHEELANQKYVKSKRAAAKDFAAPIFTTEVFYEPKHF